MYLVSFQSPCFRRLQITLNGTAAAPRRPLQRPVVVVVIDCEQFVNGIWNKFFVLLFHLLIGRRHPPALRLQLWSDLVRTLRLESLTQTGCLVGQLSMQWGSMLPMKALFYHLVDLLGSKLFPGVAGGALDRRRHVLSSLSLSLILPRPFS